jgi:hypothetical protein
MGPTIQLFSLADCGKPILGLVVSYVRETTMHM